ncbi:hypothetical protein P368_21305 [Comamonas thiooxydans]|nr:hypothetical protein P369_18340 [Comamonas thiooxydans]KGG96591.1 hypothetical protein P367_19020 [Comamonas thiooxydans]KGG98685.1 hypothetical protein P365_22810 [Comamonas thiooxydans]KGH07504.1 hypothetical protein P368_21305 [Comamonas thiooxydans]
MTPHEVAFLRRLAAEQPQALRNDGIAARMLKEHGLGALRGARVFYGAFEYTRAADMLHNRGYALEAMREPFARSQAPAGGSEKLGALPVLHEIVAVVPLGVAGFTVPVGTFMGMPWRDALALNYEVLLVCENLEPMLLLQHGYPWLARFINGRSTLALFRGKPGLFSTAAAARLIAEDARPTLAFFDFDPKGLSMAASLPRREALCLPAWSALEVATRQAKRENLFVRSLHGSQVHLNRVEDAEISEAWRRLKELAIGLNQEGFPQNE